MRIQVLFNGVGYNAGVRCRPGDATIHHCEIIHHSEPNRTDQSRLGLLFVYRGEHTRTDERLKAKYWEAVTATPPA